MSAAVWSLLAVLAIPVLLLFAALVTPVKLGCVARSAPEARLTVVLRLFGGLAPPVRIHDSRRRSIKGKRAAKRTRKKSRSQQALARMRRTLTEPRLFVDLLRPIHIEHLTVDADFGLADPADTGQLYGQLTPLLYSGLLPSAASVAIRPHFSGARLSGEAAAGVSFIPAAFVPPAVRLAWRAFGPYS